MQKLNKFMETEFFYGFCYGIAVGTVFFSGVPLVVLLGFVIFVVTFVQRKLVRSRKNNA